MQYPAILFSEVSVAAQTAFANLENAAKAREFSKSVADVRGSFAKKIVKGSTYWYYQRKDPDGIPIQVYLGPEDEQLKGLMLAHKDPVQLASLQHLARLTESAVAIGCATITPKHGRVIRRIAEQGFFQAGGVLAGTHAFLAYQNMLGVTWSVADMTMDLDFAHPGRNVSVAFPDQLKVDLRSAIESLKMGFAPIHGQARFKKQDEPDFDVDFLTTKGRGGDAPVTVKSLGIDLQPLKFMELAFERPAQTTLLLNDGPLVVTVPRPEYFCLHKLIVSQERKDADGLKSQKDHLQAAAIMQYFLEFNPQRLVAAYEDVISRGPGWKSRLTASLKRMSKDMPDLKLPELLHSALAAQDARADDNERPGG